MIYSTYDMHMDMSLLALVCTAADQLGRNHTMSM